MNNSVSLTALLFCQASSWSFYIPDFPRRKNHLNPELITCFDNFKSGMLCWCKNVEYVECFFGPLRCFWCGFIALWVRSSLDDIMVLGLWVNWWSALQLEMFCFWYSRTRRTTVLEFKVAKSTQFIVDILHLDFVVKGTNAFHKDSSSSQMKLSFRIFFRSSTPR